MLNTPLEGAVQEYQTELPRDIAAINGSPVSLVAEKLSPVTVAVGTEGMTVALANWSLEGAAATDRFNSRWPVSPSKPSTTKW